MRPGAREPTKEALTYAQFWRRINFYLLALDIQGLFVSL